MKLETINRKLRALNLIADRLDLGAITPVFCGPMKRDVIQYAKECIYILGLYWLTPTARWKLKPSFDHGCSRISSKLITANEIKRKLKKLGIINNQVIDLTFDHVCYPINKYDNMRLCVIRASYSILNFVERNMLKADGTYKSKYAIIA